jgi:pimeloyl-ACP methyl ester carboxylesterase
MTQPQLYRISLVAIVCLFLATAFATGTAAQASMPSGVKNILLVHGAWADGSSWSKVVTLLQAEGFHCVAVQIPLTSLADDVATTKRAIACRTAR